MNGIFLPKDPAVPIAGTVINDVDLRKQRAYGYSGYAYNYSYGKAARG